MIKSFDVKEIFLDEFQQGAMAVTGSYNLGVENSLVERVYLFVNGQLVSKGTVNQTNRTFSVMHKRW